MKDMGITKKDKFSEQQNNIASIAKVLGHPARIAILEHIINNKSCVCGSIVKIVNLAQPTISQHLNELKNIGIIKGNVEGTSVCYCIDDSRWNEIQGVLNAFFNNKVNSNCK